MSDYQYMSVTLTLKCELCDRNLFARQCSKEVNTIFVPPCPTCMVDERNNAVAAYKAKKEEAYEC